MKKASISIRPRRSKQRNRHSWGLDLQPTRAIVAAIHREDAGVARAVGRELPAITRTVDAIARAFTRGGHLFYVGAGTSGRLAALDAAECPPTFNTSPELVQAIVAGGRRALTRAMEGAEDSAAQGARDLAARRATRKDVVVGLTASGTTPYVLGALREARRRGATTVALTSSRRSTAARLARIAIAPETGPEVIAGSTRMKAGTAQKMVLTMLSTAAMIRSGRVYNNWMVDVALTNDKLRRRAECILQEATGADAKQAADALRQSGNRTRVALAMLKGGTTAEEARRRLRAAGGDLRRALGERRAKRGARTR